MVSLQDFKTYPGPGETSILEKDGRLSTMPKSELNIAAYPLIAQYPDINISRELCHFTIQHQDDERLSLSTSSSAASAPQQQPHYHQSSPGGAATTAGARRAATAGPAVNILRPVADEPLIKRCSRIFFEEGLVAALQEATATGPPDVAAGADSPPYIALRAIARQALRLIELLGRAQLYIQPQQRQATVASNAIRLSQTRDWQRSLIRSIAFHRHCMRLAVAACDDSVRIYTDGTHQHQHHHRIVGGSGSSVVPLLKSHLQKGITAMAWRPFTAGELAVGCQKGVLIWAWDPNSNATRPLMQPLHLQLDQHRPVTAVDWSSDGRLLATASCADTDIQLWDVDQPHRRVALRRVGAPCALLSWSPNGRSVFTSTVTNVFRVWSTQNWTPERWTVPAGAVQSAAWSPCGGYLLFVTTDEQCVYSLCFMEEQLFANSSTPKAALPVVDLTRLTVGTTEVGGRPQSIVWDASGQRLAVSFKDTPAVAIFLTSVSRARLSIVPDCLLVGLSAEVPHCIAFQPRYDGKSETVLAIGWSTGRVQFFPFL